MGFLASISVTTYNRKELSEVTIRSIRKNTPKGQYELIVVDNCSDDGTIRMLKEMKIDGTIDKLFINNWNKHLGVATNQCFDLADREAKWLINFSNDHYAMEGWFQNLQTVACYWDLDYVYGVLRPGTCNVPRQVKNIYGGSFLVPHPKVQIGGGIAIKHEKVKEHDIRFVERWNGRIGSIYTVLHQDLTQNGLKGLELAKPCILTQNCEFNNLVYAQYYKRFFQDRGTEDRLNRMKENNGYMTEEEIQEYYKGSGYDFHLGAKRNASKLR